LPLPYLLRFDHGHIVIATILALLLCGIALQNRRSAIVVTTVFLAFQGDYRRYVGYFAGFPENDPLLLVGPLAALVLFSCALLDRRTSMRGGLAKLVGALMVIMVLQIFNPLQGGLQVGFAGALFYLVPLLWFWIGRAYASSELIDFLTFRVVLVVGVAATLWGIYQSFFGLLGFEQVWVDEVGYTALHISHQVVRAIGFFSSSAEYQRYLMVAGAVLLAAALCGRRRMWLLLPFVVLAIFLSAARGPVVMLTGTAIVLWSIKARAAAAWTPRFALAVILGGGALIAALLFLQDQALGGRIAPLVNRQVEGLLDPTNPEKSTATGHLQLVANAFVEGALTPAGHGLGSTTIAAAKYGAQLITVEVDFANIPLALGVVGALLYFPIIAVIFLKALQWWRKERNVIAFATLGILTITFGAWLIGGEYSVAALVWFYVGALDRLSREAREMRRRSGRSAARVGGRRYAAGAHNA
jgi:hypothetical protein